MADFKLIKTDQKLQALLYDDQYYLTFIVTYLKRYILL